MRHPLGGFRCADCGFAGDTYADMGFGEASGYVNPTRHLYSRQNGGEMTTLTGPRRYE